MEAAGNHSNIVTIYSLSTTYILKQCYSGGLDKKETQVMKRFQVISASAQRRAPFLRAVIVTAIVSTAIFLSTQTLLAEDHCKYTEKERLEIHEKHIAEIIEKLDLTKEQEEKLIPLLKERFQQRILDGQGPHRNMIKKGIHGNRGIHRGFPCYGSGDHGMRLEMNWMHCMNRMDLNKKCPEKMAYSHHGQMRGNFRNHGFRQTADNTYHNGRINMKHKGHECDKHQGRRQMQCETQEGMDHDCRMHMHGRVQKGKMHPGMHHSRMSLNDKDCYSAMGHNEHMMKIEKVLTVEQLETLRKIHMDFMKEMHKEDSTDDKQEID